MSNDHNEGLDLAGLGKVAKAIPEDVYKQSIKSVIDTFTQLTSPITESTSGLGRYIKQKFDNMVEAEKALAAYTVQNAIEKAEAKAKKQGGSLIGPPHAKSFVKSIEEASKEIDPTLHEMWENLIADQLINTASHPHFVEVLPHFSPAEAKILLSLKSRDKVGENAGGYMYYSDDLFKHWVRHTAEEKLTKWDYSCILLLEFKFADILAAKDGRYDKNDEVTVLFKTDAGDAFLSAVSE